MNIIFCGINIFLLNVIYKYIKQYNNYIIYSLIMTGNLSYSFRDDSPFEE